MFGYNSPESLASAREIPCEKRIELLYEWKLKVIEVLGRLEDTVGDHDKYLVEQLTELRYAISDLQGDTGKSYDHDQPRNFNSV